VAGDTRVTTGDRWRAGRVRTTVAAAADVIWLVVFVVLGRTSHTEGETLAGVARTLWPFLVGLALGWLVGRAWRAPAAVVPTGVVVWPVCVAAAMVLRAVSGQGVAAAFIAVAMAFVGLGLLGWRAAVGLAQRGRTGHRAPEPSPGATQT
jgi:hypothetical protein